MQITLVFAKTAPLCAVTFALLGCAARTAVPAYLINETSDSLSIGLSMTRTTIQTSGGPRSICGFDPDHLPILGGKSEEARDTQFRGWRAVEVENYDSGHCTGNIVLRPNAAALLFWNGSCSDYANDAAGKPVEPALTRLTITGGEQSIRLENHDIARAFKFSRWNRDCKFVIR